MNTVTVAKSATVWKKPFSSAAAEEIEMSAMENCCRIVSLQRASVSSTAKSNKQGVGPYDLYPCKTCSRVFSSYQALGGHCASHKNAKSTKSNEFLLEANTTAKETTRSHKCKVCGHEFPTGQALGGHTSKHRAKRMKVEASSTPPMASVVTDEGSSGNNCVKEEEVKGVSEDMSNGCDDEMDYSNLDLSLSLWGYSKEQEVQEFKNDSSNLDLNLSLSLPGY